MSYISAIQKGDDVIVWERDENGERIEQIYRAPFYFYIDDEDGDHETIFGTRVSKIESPTHEGHRRAIKSFQEKGIRLWESDIPPELRILSTHYHDVPAPKLHKTFYDIEINYDPNIGFARVSNPYAPINAISLLHYWKKEYVLIIVPPDDTWTEERLEHECNAIEPIPSQYNVRFILCDSEDELLATFIDEIQDSDIICGWNSDMFDTPYVGKRMIARFGERSLRRLDFEGATPKWRDVKSAATQKLLGETLDLLGRVRLDYMALVKKYEPGERSSYKLASIADAVLVDENGKPTLPKLEYPGTLHNLYYSNFAFFARYSIRDTEILGAFEDKLGYVELANDMVHISCGLFSHVLGTLKLAEYATVNYCHHTLDRIVPNTVRVLPQDDRQIEGALVLEPKQGMHEWIGSIDITSLYPSAIRSINISPETLRGQFLEKVVAAEAIAQGSSMLLNLELENGEHVEDTAYNFRQWLQDNKYVVSGYGTVFDQSKKGIIPAILEEWFATRKKYQAMKRDAEKAKNYELAAYYDRLQYVYKIKLNSYYGSLANLYFRFYDVRMGESTTGTGRMVLRHQCSMVNQILGDGYSLEGDAVIYGDTDSAYFKTYATDKQSAIAIADAVGKKVNESYKKFMQDTFLCTPGYDDIIKCAREVVSDRGIFVEKKRYILHLVDKEGKSVDTLKVMGLDTKKTSLPKEVADNLNDFIGRLLKGEDWSTISTSIVEYKNKLERTEDIFELGLPKSVKEIDHFYDDVMFKELAKVDAKTGKVRVSGHVAAALHYNWCLSIFEDKVSLPITDGMKVKLFYITNVVEPYRLPNGQTMQFKSIAIPTDIEVIPQWFYENFSVDIPSHIERLVDNPLENILGAINKKSPTKQSILVDSLLEF